MNGNLDRDLLRKVADSIALTSGLAYNQETWFDFEGDEGDEDWRTCGTCACVAGHAIFVRKGMDALVRADEESYVPVLAGALLGLTEEQEQVLFAIRPIAGRINMEFDIPEEHRIQERQQNEPGHVFMSRVLRAIADHAPDTGRSEEED